MAVKRKQRAKGAKSGSKTTEVKEVARQAKMSRSRKGTDLERPLTKQESVGMKPDSTSKFPNSSRPSNQISQLELITMSCSSDIKLNCEDDKWTCGYKRRNIMRGNVTEAKPLPKNKVNYHKNNFHGALKDNWSKLVTDKISALAFSRSLRGNRRST